MSWSELLLLILGTLITSILGIAFAYLRAYIVKKTKNEELKKFLLDIDEIVENNVKYVFQTYVETLKDQDIFDKKNQAIALNKCKDLILNDFTEDMKDYIAKNYGDIIKWVLEKIEVKIYDLKK